MNTIRNGALITAAVGALSIASLSPAAIIDLTVAGSSATANGAIYQTTTEQSTGTGVIQPFLRLQANGAEQGYNTSGSPLPFDDKPGPWTHDLQASDILGVTMNGVLYAAFLLDINESNSPANRLLSVDSVQLYTSPTPSQTTIDVPSLGTLQYDLDSGTDNWIVLDYSNNRGSGSGDLMVFIPASSFSGVDASDYVYLYTAMGLHNSSDAGFEEWSNFGDTHIIPVPTPGAFALLGLGGLILTRRRR